MSTDLQMCYKMVAAVKSGHLPNAMQEMQCGPLCHARWLTTVLVDKEAWSNWGEPQNP